MLSKLALSCYSAGSMIRVQPLFDSPLVRIERCDHPLEVPHVDPEEERSMQYTINCVERGLFSVTAGRRTWNVGPGDLFVTVPGFVYRCDHHDNPTDVCLSVCFGSEADRDGLNAVELAQHAPVVATNNRRAYLRRRLAQRLADSADRLTIESIAGDMLDAATDGARSRRVYSDAQLTWYAHRVDAARERLDVEYGSPQSLATLAREAGMSPFHFARVFRELAGVPPHRYLIAVRLRAAIERLRAGDSVTGTCFAVGFNSLGHFIEMFRRRYGVSPSRIRSAGL